MIVSDRYADLRYLERVHRSTKSSLIYFRSFIDGVLDDETGRESWTRLAKALTTVNEQKFVEHPAADWFTAGYLELLKASSRFEFPEFNGCTGSSYHYVVAWGTFSLPSIIGEVAHEDPPENWLEEDDYDRQWEMVFEKHWDRIRSDMISWRKDGDEELSDKWISYLELEYTQGAILLARHPVTFPDDEDKDTAAPPAPGPLGGNGADPQPDSADGMPMVGGLANNAAHNGVKIKLALPTNPRQRDLWLYLHEHFGSGKTDNALARAFVPHDPRTGTSLLQQLRNARRDKRISCWRC
jgi:hypothetical protein